MIKKLKLFIKNNVLKWIVDRFYLSKLPVNKNNIVFILSRVHDDNSLVLFDYIYKNESTNYSYSFIVKNEDYYYYKKLLNNYEAKIYRNLTDFFTVLKLLSTSKYIFFMRGKPFLNLTKKRGQLRINLWHGSGYKDVVHVRDETEFDYVLVPGKAHIKPKAKFFSCTEEKILPIGYPRYDLFNKINTQDANYIKNEYLKNNKKLIIWMPTYRNTDDDDAKSPESKISYNYDLPLLNSVDDLINLDKFCHKKEVSILIKRHPSQKRYEGEKEELTNIFFADNEELSKAGIAVYSLLNSTDALISDYSSVAIDYLLLNRPIAYVLDDFDQYKSTRGFVFEDPLKYMPGDHIYKFEDLLAFVDNISKSNDSHYEERNRVFLEIHNPCDCFSRRIWETVQELGLHE